MPDGSLTEDVDDLVARAVGTGDEIGLQVVVIHQGRTLVDRSVGTADSATAAPVDDTTLFWVGSAAKAMASTVAHVLIDRGELDDDLRLVDVWPAYGTHGKEHTTLRHVLCHTAGVPGLPADTTATDLADWERTCATIAGAEPWWTPGTRFGYHAKTFGFLIGETLRRATGCPIAVLLEELVTGPLGILDDVRFGVPPEALPRVARQVDDAAGGAESHDLDGRPGPGSPLDRAMPAGVVPDAAYANDVSMLTADIPSEGTMSARGAARVYSALLGHVDGVELVSGPRRQQMASITFTGRDEVMQMPTSWAYGYSPSRPSGTGRAGSTFGMPGMSGSAAWADLESGVAVAFTRNRFASASTPTAAAVDQLVVDALARTRAETTIHRPGGHA